MNDPPGAVSDEGADAGREPLARGRLAPAPDEAAAGPPSPPDTVLDDPLPPPSETLDASTHAHVLDDPLPPPSETLDTPLFDQTVPLHGSPPPPPSPSADAADTMVLPAFAAEATPPTPWPPNQLAWVGAPSSPSAVRRTHLGSPPVPLQQRRVFRRTVAVLVTLLLLASSALAVYLFSSARGWRDRSESYLDTSLDLGDDLASTRSDLAGARAELEAVRAQLDTAQIRIRELADEKAKLGDEWEITQQLVDYQERVSDAAGQVALSLDQCVQGQQQFIGYLQLAAKPGGPVYDPVELARFETDVEALCQVASEANIALQLELSR